MLIDPNKFTIIAGPCVLEDHKMAMDTALRLQKICEQRNLNYIFKASFAKANRTSGDSFRGLDFYDCIKIFSDIQELGIKCTTDVHETFQMNELKKCIDMVQIPAYLCRQTDLIECAGSIFPYVNIKKGQFANCETMKHAVNKAQRYSTEKYPVDVYLTERGTTFGYEDLVVDMRNIVDMKHYGKGVFFDATHSCQKPGKGKTTGGSNTYAGILTRAAIAVGVIGIFMEVHPKPSKAKSDRSTQLSLEIIENWIDTNIMWGIGYDKT